jgi:zinc protease
MTTVHELEGGAKLFVEAHHTIPLVSIVVALRRGNGHDPEGKDGLARIAMRMLRRGVHGLDARAVDDRIDRLGGEMAVDTSSSSVAVHGQVIARNLDAYADLLAQMLAAPTLPDDELERLKRETAAELAEGRDSDRNLAQKAFRHASFGAHPYGRDGAGKASTVAGIGLDDVKAFHRREVVKSSLVFGFAGDVTDEKARAIAEKILAALPAGPAPEDTIGPPTFATGGRRLVFVDKPERSQTQILIGGTGTWPHDDDHAALGIGTAIFGGTFTSRLMKEVRSKRGWSYGASARASIDRQRQTFSMWTFPSSTDAAACIELQLGMWEKLVKEGVTPKEVAFMQRFLARSHAFEVDTAQKRLHQFLDVEILNLPADYYSGYLEHVKAVTAESTSAALANRLAPQDALVVVVGTAKDLLASVEKVIPGLVDTQVIPFDKEDGV